MIDVVGCQSTRNFNAPSAAALRIKAGHVLIDNQPWDAARQHVVTARTVRSGCQRIVDAKYDPEMDMTVLSLESQDVVEIEL